MPGIWVSDDDAVGVGGDTLMTSIAPISRIKVLDVYRWQACTGAVAVVYHAWNQGCSRMNFLSDLIRPDPFNPNGRKSN